MPRIEIPVSDHHHSLFHAAKRIVRLQVSSEEGKESRRLVLISYTKSEISRRIRLMTGEEMYQKLYCKCRILVLLGCNCILKSSLLCGIEFVVRFPSLLSCERFFFGFLGFIQKPTFHKLNHISIYKVSPGLVRNP